MSSTLPSGLPEVVHDEEDLARFITSKQHISKTKRIVKAPALTPNKEGETSVFRHGESPEPGLWRLADQNIQGRNVYGAAIFKAGSVRKVDLDVVAKEPPPRHADIINWPSEALGKARQKQIALLIAQEAKLVLK